MRRYMVRVLSYGVWGWEQGPALSLADAVAQAARLSTLPHVGDVKVESVY